LKVQTRPDSTSLPRSAAPGFDKSSSISYY
jgi:hypothetical protein